MTPPARTIFLGSGGFAIPILARLAEHPRVELVAVVTAPARARGRGRREQPSPVGAWAAARQLPTLTPPRLRAPAAIAEIARLQPELLVLADYGQIVPRQLLELPVHGALNVHPSLLPRHRGASPIAAAILAGDAATGVTLMLMDAGLDTGPIVAQRRLPLHGNETAIELEQRLAGDGAALLSETLDAWLAGAAPTRAQPEEGVTVTRPLRREDGRLSPLRRAIELERQVRAYQPWPGSYLETPPGRLIVWRARVLPDVEESPGRLLARTAGEAGPSLLLGTVDGALELVEVQPAGGRRMSAAELLRGRPGLADVQLDLPPAAGSAGER